VTSQLSTRRTRPAGSSGLSVGVIETQYVEPLEIELRILAMRFFAELERDHGLEIIRTGYLRLAHTAEQAERYAVSDETQHSLDVSSARIVERAEIAAIAPDMSLEGIECGLWGPGDGFIDGHLYCSPLVELLEMRGVSIRAPEEVLGSENLPDGRHRVITTRGEITADYLVNAAGAWAPIVWKRIGACLPIKPQRHEAVVVHQPRRLDYVMPMVMDYTPHSGELGLYFRHERPGQLIAGLHSEEETPASLTLTGMPEQRALIFSRASLNGSLSGPHRWPTHGWPTAGPGSIRPARTACRRPARAGKTPPSSARAAPVDRKSSCRRSLAS
jgi:sarcosine oxidase subunit beta